MFGKIPLQLQQSFADGGNGGDLGRGVSGRFVAQSRIGQNLIDAFGIKSARLFGRGGFVGRIGAGLQNGVTDGAVQSARIQKA